MTRTRLLATAPAALALLLAWHPTDPARAIELTDQLGRWLTVHLGLLVLLPLVALSLHRLLADLNNATARTAQRLLLPATVLYASFDTLLGIGTGVLVQQAGQLPAHQRASALALAEAWWSVPPVLAVVATAAVVGWAVALATTALAVHRAGRTLPAVAILASTVLFAAGHPGVTGALAMLVLTAGIMLDPQPREALAPAGTPS